MIVSFLLLVVSAIPYGLGWIAGWIAWFVLWFGRTVKWGWQDVHKRRTRSRSLKR